MDNPTVIPDKDIRSNDEDVNEDVSRLRPSTDNPAKTTRDNFRVTIDLPKEGVPVDRVRLPTNDNIDTIRVYYFTPDDNTPVPVDDEVGIELF